MNIALKRDKNRVCRQYPARLLPGRYAFYSLSLFLLGLLALVSACGISANTSSANAVSSPPVVPDPAHASITNVAATGEVVYLVVNGRLYLWQFDGTLEVVDLQQGSVLWRYVV